MPIQSARCVQALRFHSFPMSAVTARFPIAAVVIAVTAVAAIGTASVAEAKCGVIAISSIDRKHFGANSFADCRQAEANALKQCAGKSKGKCVSHRCNASCCSLALSNNGAFKLAAANTKAKADQIALQGCRQHKGTDCRIRRSFCNNAVKID